MYESWIRWVAGAVAVTILFAGNLVLVNLIGDHVFFRVDLTERYSTDSKSRDLFEEVEGRVIARYLVSKNTLPKTPEHQSLEQEVRDRLSEYERFFTKGELRIEFEDPVKGADEITSKVKAELAASGVHPLTQKIEREGGGKREYTFYSTLKILHRGKEEIINKLSDPRLLEYEFVAALSRLREAKLPTIGLAVLAPAGESPFETQVKSKFSDMMRARAEVETVDLAAGPPALEKIQVLYVVVHDKVTDLQLFEIDQYLLKGGRVVLCIDPVTRLRYLPAKVPEFGIGAFLEHVGVRFEPNMMFDLRDQKQFYSIYGPLRPAYEFEILSENVNPDFPRAGIVEELGFSCAMAIEPAPGASKRGLDVDYLIRGSGESWTEDLAGANEVDIHFLLKNLIVPHCENSLAAWREEKKNALGADVPISPIVALVVEGSFESYFASSGAPEGSSKSNYDLKGEGGLEVKEGERKVIVKNPEANRLVVVGDADWLVSVAEREGNRDFLYYLTDWLREETYLTRLHRKSKPADLLVDRNSKEARETFESRKVVYQILMSALAPLVVLALGIVKIVLRYQEKVTAESSWRGSDRPGSHGGNVA